MSVVIVIPARYASQRYPGKPLVPLKGATGIGKSLIVRCWEAAQLVTGVDRVLVATDDDRIAEAARAVGAEVAMTAEGCRNGTERCADALRALDETPEIVVNLQGDAPLTPPWFVEALVAGLRADPEAALATPVLRCTGAMRADLLAERRAGRVGGTTAVLAADGAGLYFSKEVLPFDAAPYGANDLTHTYHHIGCYAYRPDVLAEYPTWPTGPLETAEGLEQLRFLENTKRVACVEVDGRGRDFWELNNPEDVPRIEAALVALGIA